MRTIRMNVPVPEDLALEIERIAGRRKRSQFILDTLKRRVEEIRKEDLRARLVKGYQATREEDLEITNEFEASDLEGWDEY